MECNPAVRLVAIAYRQVPVSTMCSAERLGEHHNDDESTVEVGGRGHCVIAWLTVMRVRGLCST